MWTNIRYDNGSNDTANAFSCFKGHQTVDTDGAWVEELQNNQREKFNAVIGKVASSCTQVQSFSSRRSKKSIVTVKEKAAPRILNKAFLLKQKKVFDADTVVRVSVRDIVFEGGFAEDINEFEHLEEVDASATMLTFDAFKSLPNLTALNFSVNALHDIDLSKGYKKLIELDLSYNSIDGDDFLRLGQLPQLTSLNLSANDLANLPSIDYEQAPLFQKLRRLLLDNNKLTKPSDWIVLCYLPNLDSMSLKNNRISMIPFIESGEKSYIIKDISIEARKSAKAGRNGRRTPKPTGIATREKTQGGASEEESGEVEDFDFEAAAGEINKEIDARDEDLVELPPPFPELRVLDLSENEIAKDSSVLGVATWPALQHLSLANNPLTMRNRTERLSYLTDFLKTKLMISVVYSDQAKKKKQAKPPLPPVVINSKRIVSTAVPKVPKMNIDDFIQMQNEARRLSSRMIGSITPNSQSRSALPEMQSRDTISEKDADDDGDEIEEEETAMATAAASDDETATASAAFFLTELDGQKREEDKAECEDGEADDENEPEETNLLNSKFETSLALLEDDSDIRNEELALPSEQNITATVSCLRNTLKQGLLFHDDTIDLHEHRLFQKHQKHWNGVKKTNIPNQNEKTVSLLENQKNRKTVTEMSLKKALSKRGRSRKDHMAKNEYRTTDALMKDVQKHYNQLRKTRLGMVTKEPSTVESQPVK